MKLRIGVYNVQWMRDLFEPDGSPKTSAQDGIRSQKIADIVKAMNCDFLGIVEGPDTLVNGSKTASSQLENWANHFIPGNSYKAIHGFPSPGQQELAAIYDASKFNVLFTPETKDGERFNEPFLMDTTNRMIKEQYKHYRPPLTRFEIGINLKGQTPQGILEAETKTNAMCSHKITVNHEEQITAEIISWLKKAYEAAG
jgi:hypothetical protein